MPFYRVFFLGEGVKLDVIDRKEALRTILNIASMLVESAQVKVSKLIQFSQFSHLTCESYLFSNVTALQGTRFECNFPRMVNKFLQLYLLNIRQKSLPTIKSSR